MKSSLASIHPEARIAENVTIEPFSTIYKDVEIGEGTWIGPNVTIMDGARIGKNCKIFPGAVIAAIPQDLKFAGEVTTAEIGDNTTIRECVTVNRATKTKMRTTVGSNCLLMAYSHVAHDCKIGNYVIIGNGTQIAGEVEINDWAILSANVLVHQFARIGAHCYIGGAGLVRKDVPPYVLASREPLSYAGLNVVGLRRRKFDSETISQIQKIYRIIFQDGNNISNAIRIIENEIPDSPVREEIMSFIRTAERGLMRGYTGKKTDDDEN